MKTIITTIAALVIIGFAGEVAAQTVYGPINDATAAQLNIDRQLTATATQCVTNVYACGGAPCPEATLNQCNGAVKAAKACPNCATRAWVLKKLKGILDKNEAELKALRDELLGKLKELEDRIAALEANDRLQDAAIAEGKEHDGVQDQRLDALEAKDKKQDLRDDELEQEMANVDGQIDFELAGTFFGTPHILAFGGMFGVQLGASSKVDLIGDLSLGGTTDGDLAFAVQAGMLYYVGENNHFGVGVAGLFTKERLDDEGDFGVGGGIDLRYRTGNGFFIGAFVGVGVEGRLVTKTIQVDGDKLTEREFGLSILFGIKIGWESTPSVKPGKAVEDYDSKR